MQRHTVLDTLEIDHTYVLFNEIEILTAQHFELRRRWAMEGEKLVKSRIVLTVYFGGNLNAGVAILQRRVIGSCASLQHVAAALQVVIG